MGGCCTSTKGQQQVISPVITPKSNVRVTPHTEPEENKWDQEENKTIQSLVAACETELKQLIATPETFPDPHAYKPGINIYGKETPRGFLMKSEWKCPHSPETVLAFIQNNTLRPIWDPYLAECLSKGLVKDNIQLTYERDNVKFIPSPRDILYAGKVCPHDNGLLYVKVSVERQDIPLEEGVIRTNLFVGGYHILPTDQGSLVTLYSEMDFGGAVPKEVLVKASAKRLLGWVEAFNEKIASLRPLD